MRKFLGLILFFLFAFNDSVNAQCSSIDFSINNSTGCLPLSIQAKAKGYIKGSSFSWDFGGGFSNYNAADSTKIFIFVSAGSKNISLKVKDSLGNVCAVTKNNIVNVGQATFIDLRIVTPILCSTSDSAIIIDSTPNIIKREWIIDGVKTKNGKQSIHPQFSSIGYKSVSLLVTNNSGCSYIKILDSAIRVFNPMVYNFNAKFNSFCPIYTDTFTCQLTTSKSRIATYEWTFPNGVPNFSNDSIPAITYSDTGKFDVTLSLIDTNGCKYTLTKKNYIAPFNLVRPSISFSKQNICNEDTLYINNTTPPGNIGGYYSLNLFNGTAAGGNINSGLQKVKFNSSGKKSLLLRYNNTNCNADSLYDSIIFVSKIKTYIKSDTNIFCYLNDTVHFYDSTISYPASISSYSWEVRNLNNLLYTSNDSNPSFAFNDWGKYDIKLSVINSMGCKAEILSRDYVILDTPIAKIEIRPLFACINDTIFFRDKTNKFNYGKPYYRWYILDTDSHTVLFSDTTEKIQFKFTKQGRYFAQLITFNDFNCIDTVFDSIGVVINSPSIDFIVAKDTVCSGEVVSLMQTTTPAYSKLKYSWYITHHDSSNVNFFITGDSVGFFPTVPGYYDVACVGNGPYCSDSLFKPYAIAVNKLIIDAMVDTATSCIPVIVKGKAWKISNIHLSNSDTTINFLWESTPNTASFSNSTSPSTNISFSTGGCYQVSVLAANSNGCTSSVYGLFNACAGQVANYSMSNSEYCADDSIVVSNKSAKNIGYKWYIKNNLPAVFYPSDTATSPKIICTDSGMYKIALIAFTSFGCPDTFIQTVKINKPYTQFNSPDSVSICGPTTVELIANSATAINYTWDFGDGSPLLKTNSTHIFHLYSITNGKNKFDIKLKVADINGCVYETSKLKYIHLIGPSPYFSINTNTGCVKQNISFKDSSLGVAKYYFNNGLGSFDTIMKNVYTFNYTDSTKDYSAYLPYIIGYDSSGQCSHIFYLKDSIRIYNKPIAQFTSDQNMVCQNSSIKFNNTSTNTTKQFWYFNNLLNVDDTSSNTSFTYNNLGKQHVKCVVENKYGCRDTSVKLNYISVEPKPKASILFADTLFCAYDTVIFIENSSFKIPLKSFEWNFGDTLITEDTSSLHIPKYRYNQPGIYGIFLKITDSIGCTDSIYIPNKINISSQTVSQKIDLHSISIDKENELSITWDKNNSLFFEKYILYRDSLHYLTPIYTSTNPDDTSFIDYVDLSLIKRDYKYGIVGYEMCTKKNKPQNIHQYIYAEIDTFSPAGLQIKWNNYIGWDTSWNAQLLVTSNLDSGFHLLKNITYQDTLFRNFPLCDSLYSYQIITQNSKTNYISNSNIVNKKPIYIKSSIGNDIAFVSVENSQLFIHWDTLPFDTFKHSFNIYRSTSNSNNFSLLTADILNNSYTDKSAEIGKTFYIYRLIRKDYCNNFIDPGNDGNSIYLNARQSEDTVYLNWNSYRYWPKGVKNYLVQLFDIEKQTFETVQKLTPLDTIWKQDKLPNFIDPNFCYRIIAQENNINKPNMSISNEACVVIPAKVFVPDAFSPNGDGINEIFKPTTSFIHYNHNKPSLQFKMTIYDRWGEKVFETEEITEGWDGKIKDKPCDAGVYYYRIYAVPYDGYEKIKLNGQFMLLR